MPISQGRSIEEWELKDNRTKLWAENVHRSQKLGQFIIAILEDLFMGDRLGNLDRKDEAVRSSSSPIADRASRRTSIERRIYLDRMEMFRIESQVID
jgi:hypothetical protein